MINLEGMPEKFRIELEDICYLYSTIQDLRVFKDNYDALLLNKCRRNAVGRIEEHYDWPSVANYMIQDLKKNRPSIGDPFSIDIKSLAALANSNEFTVYCGQVSHVPTTGNPCWQLSFRKKE